MHGIFAIPKTEAVSGRTLILHAYLGIYAEVFDLSKLKIVEHRYKGRENELKKDGFIFKYPNKKQEAILGIIKIL